MLGRANVKQLMARRRAAMRAAAAVRCPPCPRPAPQTLVVDSFDAYRALPGLRTALDQEMDTLEDQGMFQGPLSPGLSGITDIFTGDYWRQKWDEASAWLQGKAADFFKLKADLVRARKLADEVARRADARLDLPDAIRVQAHSIRDRIAAHLGEQAELEGKVLAAMEKIGAVQAEKANAGVGVIPLIPIAITAASVAALAAVVAGVIVHTQRVRQTQKELDLVARGVLSASEISRIKGAGPLGGLGTALQAIPLVIVGGLALWLLPQLTRRGR